MATAQRAGNKRQTKKIHARIKNRRNDGVHKFSTRILVDLNGHDEHGIYMAVPGLLAEFSTAEIAALMVPRPHLCAVGELDGLTPPAAVIRATEALAQAYRQAGVSTAWQLLIECNHGHVETR